VNYEGKTKRGLIFIKHRVCINSSVEKLIKKHVATCIWRLTLLVWPHFVCILVVIRKYATALLR